MKNIFSLVLVNMVLLNVSPVFADDNSCSKQINSIEQMGADYNKIIKIWLSAPSSCKQSNIYSEKLSRFYSLNREFDKAFKVIGEAKPKSDGSKKRDLELAEADIYFQKWAWESNDIEDLKKAEKAYNEIIKNHPNYYSGYSQYSGLLLVTNRNKECIEVAEKAVSFKEDYFAFRNLIIAYRQEQKYVNAIKSFSKAYNLNEQVFADKDAMLSVAVSYAELDKLELSLGALNKLIEYSPDTKHDEEFQKVARYLKKLITDRKESNT